jgi:hypothetical protein
MSSSIARAPHKARPRLSQPGLTEAQRLGLTPLEYLLAIVRDDSIEAARRDRAAQAALPYCHARLAEKTKKAADAEAAAKAGDAFGWDGDLEYGDGRGAVAVDARKSAHAEFCAAVGRPPVKLP